MDDAAQRDSTIAELHRIRREYGLSYRIMVIGWPSSREALSLQLGLPTEAALELPQLTRDEIVRICKAVGIRGPDVLLGEIANQAEGKPGLAVTLAQLALDEGWRDVWDGTALATAVKRWLVPNIGEKAVSIIAALSLGGCLGRGLGDVATELEMTKSNVQTRLLELLSAGIITETSGEALSVRPEKLRYVLLKEKYFSGAIALDPWSSLASMLDPSERAWVLLQVKHLGGDVDTCRLRKEVDAALAGLYGRRRSGDILRAYASLGIEEARDVLERYRPSIAECAEACLSHLPKETVRIAFEDAEKKADGDQTGEPLDWLGGWVRRAVPGGMDAVARRRAVFDEAMLWLGEARCTALAVQAIRIALSPAFESTSTDPGAGRKFHVHRATLSTDELRDVGAWWPEAREALRGRADGAWPTLLRLLQDWATPDWHFFGSPPNEEAKRARAGIYRAMGEVASTMASDLVELAEGNPGLMHEFQRFARLLGDTQLDLDEEFELLFSDPRGADDVEEARRQHQEKVEQLGRAWAAESCEKIAARIAGYEQQAREASIPEAARIWTLCRVIAGEVEDAIVWGRAVFEAGVTGSALEPFLDLGLERGDEGAAEFARACLANSDAAHAAVSSILRAGEAHTDLLDAALERLEDESIDARVIWGNGELSEEVLRRLLRHSRKAVASDAARLVHHLKRVDEIRVEWETTIVESCDDDWFLARVFEEQADVAFRWLERRVADNDVYWFRYDEALPTAARILTAQQKQHLLSEVPADSHAENLVQALVGYDPKLYRFLLSLDRLRQVTLAPLRRPSLQHLAFDEAGWLELAHVALESGLATDDIAWWVLDPGGAYNRGCDLWRERISWYARLLYHCRDDVREVGRVGVKFAQERLAEEEASKRREAVYGLGV
ncbi:MAG: hypothetical protein KAS72_01645 [Phycisphaerales bacterium]|nr:hypothetical protein [Phycisphaerales bacterium]